MTSRLVDVYLSTSQALDDQDLGLVSNTRTSCFSLGMEVTVLS